RVGQTHSQTERYLSSAESEFDRAWMPQGQAQRDTRSTDSSWAGYQLDRQFDSGSRQLDSAAMQMRRGEVEYGQLDRGVDQAKESMSELVRDLEAAGDQRLGRVRQAATQLEEGSQAVDSIGMGWRRFDSGNRNIEREVRMADMHIRQIQMDRPGIDVSTDGILVGNSLRDIERELGFMDRELDGSQRQVQSARRNFTQASGLLRTAGIRGEQGDPLGSMLIGAGLGGALGTLAVMAPALANPLRLASPITMRLALIVGGLGAVAGAAAGYVLASDQDLCRPK
ncbi:MAG: hypothetical protein KC910_37520, partial [Candidatus Eremiobacteraeota bacterium]|nr:hypothetical protein [Candidatus Eremiobacteraeota bacterium]